MNRKLIITLVFVLFHAAASAAPTKAKVDTGTALDILSMPEQNRYLASNKLPENQLYRELMTISGEVRHGHGIRWKAVTLAARIKGEAALKDLKEKLNAKEWFIRNAALVSIHHISAKEGHKAAFKLLKDPALVVRSAAVSYLNNDLSRAERDLLWEELSADYNFRGGQSLWVRGEILAKLSNQPSSLEAPLFQAMLKDKDQRLYPQARAALTNLGIKISK